GDVGGLYRNWFTFNLPTLTAPIISAQLKVKTWEYTSNDATETYQLQEVTTPVPTLTAGGSGLTAIYADLGDGAIYGSRDYSNGDDNGTSTIILNAAAISALTAKSGQAFAFGGLLTTLDTLSNQEYVFGFSNSVVPADVQLILNTGTATPVVTVVATDADAGEPANNGQYTLTRTGSLTSALTVNIAMSGTATNGTDYTAIPTTVTFLAGSATAVVNLNVIDDTLPEGTETAILTVLAGTGYTVGAAASATVNIADNDLPAITVAATDADAGEPTNNGQYTLTRTGSLTSALTVNIAMSGTATNGTDYATISNTVTFLAGSATATFNLSVIDDTLIEGTETAILTVLAGTGYTVGAAASATVNIADNDLPIIDLSANQTVVEGLVAPQSVTYTVTLSSDSTETITVQYATSNNTATAGSDYTATNGTLTFAQGVTSQDIIFPLLIDFLNEPQETLNLTLSSHTNAQWGT
ncbi:MAG: Calx-beta domain-containing protein, partial [Dolichospermum sp.]